MCISSVWLGANSLDYTMIFSSSLRCSLPDRCWICTPRGTVWCLTFYVGILPFLKHNMEWLHPAAYGRRHLGFLKVKGWAVLLLSHSCLLFTCCLPCSMSPPLLISHTCVCFSVLSTFYSLFTFCFWLLGSQVSFLPVSFLVRRKLEWSLRMPLCSCADLSVEQGLVPSSFVTSFYRSTCVSGLSC